MDYGDIMTDRFIIDCYGIIDTWNSTGKCEDDKLSWSELCDTLNELDDLCSEKFDEYEYIIKLKKENDLLKEKIIGISELLTKIEDYNHDIRLIID